MPKRLDARCLRRRGRPSRVLRAAVSGLAALCIAGAASAQDRVEVASPEALLEFFENLDYTPEAWQAGIREGPRVLLMDVHRKSVGSGTRVSVRVDLGGRGLLNRRQPCRQAYRYSS